MKFIAVLLVGISALGQQVNQSGVYRDAAAILSPTKKKTAKKTPDISGSISALELHRQVALPPQVLFALNLSNEWTSTGPWPTRGEGGRIYYTYGQNLPTIVCAMLQVCEVDLEPGEKLVKDSLDLGDPRFNVTPRTAGSGADLLTYLVVKPTEPGLDTTLTVGTERRAYYLRLISTSQGHMARVAFRYPEEEAARQKAQEDAKAAEKVEAERLSKLNTIKPVRNWNYKVKLHGRDADYLRPIQIGDDGVHTHILLSDMARNRGLPVVQIGDARGPIPANRHWSGNELVVDALFEHADLLSGVGRKQQRACIKNEGLRGN